MTHTARHGKVPVSRQTLFHLTSLPFVLIFCHEWCFFSHVIVKFAHGNPDWASLPSLSRSWYTPALWHVFSRAFLAWICPLNKTDHGWPWLTIADHGWPWLTMADHGWSCIMLLIFVSSLTLLSYGSVLAVHVFPKNDRSFGSEASEEKMRRIILSVGLIGNRSDSSILQEYDIVYPRIMTNTRRKRKVESTDALEYKMVLFGVPTTVSLFRADIISRHFTVVDVNHPDKEKATDPSGFHCHFQGVGTRLYWTKILHCLAVFGPFSPAPVKTDRAVRIQ